MPHSRNAKCCNPGTIKKKLSTMARKFEIIQHALQRSFENAEGPEPSPWKKCVNAFAMNSKCLTELALFLTRA